MFLYNCYLKTDELFLGLDSSINKNQHIQINLLELISLHSTSRPQIWEFRIQNEIEYISREDIQSKLPIYSVWNTIEEGRVNNNKDKVGFFQPDLGALSPSASSPQDRDTRCTGSLPCRRPAHSWNLPFSPHSVVWRCSWTSWLLSL